MSIHFEGFSQKSPPGNFGLYLLATTTCKGGIGYLFVYLGHTATLNKILFYYEGRERMGKNYLNGSFFFLSCFDSHFFPTNPQPCPHSFSPFGEILLTFFIHSFSPPPPHPPPPRPEPCLILVVLGSCPVADTGITHIHSLSQLEELDHFLITSHITGPSHFFGATDRNLPWFQ